MRFIFTGIIVLSLAFWSPVAAHEAVQPHEEPSVRSLEQRSGGASPLVVAGFGIAGAAAVGFFVLTRIRKKP